MNPRACRETELVIRPAAARKRVAVVGAGPAGLAVRDHARRSAATRSTSSTRAAEIGGQFNMAKRIPGKEEFDETMRYFRRRIEVTGVRLHLARRVSAADLEGYDEVVLATGVRPRDPGIAGEDDPRVLSYIDVLRDAKPVGKRVAIVGAGGIGFDVAEFLVHDGPFALARHRGVAQGVGRGRSGGGARRRGGREAASRHRRPGRSTCCSARRRSPARGWARPRAGSTAPRSR